MGSGMRAASNERRPTSGDLRALGVGRSGVRREPQGHKDRKGPEQGSLGLLHLASPPCGPCVPAVSIPARRSPRDVQTTTRLSRERAHQVRSNKPMVPTALTAPRELPPTFALRRHIGQPLGSREERRLAIANERLRAARTQKTCQEQRAARRQRTDREWRTTGELRR
jgi:hypothetical protein